MTPEIYADLVNSIATFTRKLRKAELEAIEKGLIVCYEEPKPVLTDRQVELIRQAISSLRLTQFSSDEELADKIEGSFGL